MPILYSIPPANRLVMSRSSLPGIIIPVIKYRAGRTNLSASSLVRYIG